MILSDWHDRLEQTERELGLDDGFRFVYGPAPTLEKGKMAFLSLNPGRAPSGTIARQVAESRGNSYEMEKSTTRSPLTDQALRCFSFFGFEPRNVMTGVVCPFRTPAWSDLSSSQRRRALALGQEFWAAPLNRQDLDLIICCSNEAARCVTTWTKAKLEAEASAGWGEIKISRYRTQRGVPILALPHLSRFKLFGRPASESAIRVLMGF